MPGSPLPSCSPRYQDRLIYTEIFESEWSWREDTAFAKFDIVVEGQNQSLCRGVEKDDGGCTQRYRRQLLGECEEFRRLSHDSEMLRNLLAIDRVHYDHHVGGTLQ